MERVAYFQKDSVIKGTSLIFGLALDRCHSTGQEKNKQNKNNNNKPNRQKKAPTTMKNPNAKPFRKCPKRTGGSTGVASASFLPPSRGVFHLLPTLS